MVILTTHQSCSSKISYRQAFLIFLERERQLIDKWNNPKELPISPYAMFDDFYKLIKEIEQLPIEDNHQ